MPNTPQPTLRTMLAAWLLAKLLKLAKADRYMQFNRQEGWTAFNLYGYSIMIVKEEVAK